MSPVLPTQNDHPEDASEDEVGAGDVPQPVIMNVDSDSGSYSDEEIHSHEGYELLSQDPDSISNLTENDNSEIPVISLHGADAGETGSNEIVCCSLFSEACRISGGEEVKASPEDSPSHCTESKGYSMDEEHIGKIKEAMKGFTLPSSSVPAWASVVPEEEWKMQISSFLQSKGNAKNNICSNIKSKCDSSPCTSKEHEKNKVDKTSSNE